MAKPRKRKEPEELGDIPAGATQQASDRDERPGGTRHTPLVDRHATGDDPDVGLVGPLEEDEFADEQEGPPYAGFSGGAVGGSPAEGRAVGGETHGGLAPQQGTRNVDSTIGRDRPAARKAERGNKMACCSTSFSLCPMHKLKLVLQHKADGSDRSHQGPRDGKIKE